MSERGAESVGERIRQKRAEEGFTRADAAQAIGVSHSTVREWEQGAVSPHDQNRRKIEYWLADEDEPDDAAPETQPAGDGSGTGESPGKPTMTVSTEHVEIDVVDRQTAKLALEVIDEVLPAWLGETSHVPRNGQQQRERVEYEAECPECGHSWTRRARDDTRATCPECSHSWTHETRGRERPDAEVLG